MMKLNFDKRLDEGIMKAYCIDFQIIETTFINSSEISSLRLRWETAVALQAETGHAGHADISSRKRQPRQAVHSVFPSMQGVQTFGCSPSMPSERQVQSAAPMEKPTRGLQVQGQKGTAGAGTVRIFPQVGKYRSLLGDFPHASLRVR
jgi:predicted PhzF superfamily epimerase YddE/YHI9